MKWPKFRVDLISVNMYCKHDLKWPQCKKNTSEVGVACRGGLCTLGLSEVTTILVHCVLLQQGGLAWRRELAALIIQLGWRKYLRRRLLRRSVGRQKILNDWTPSVMAARQKVLVQKVYGKTLL